MFSHNNNKYRSKGRSTSNWERFVSACTHSLGGFYRPDGTIFKDPELSEQGRDLDFADLVQRTHQRLRHQEMLRQMNIEAITQRAYERLEDSECRRELDQDWVNLFFSYAQDISNVGMQDLWSRALALEIVQPGSISKHCLGYLRNCDAWELKAFRKVAASAFLSANGHPFIFRAKSHVSANDPIFSEPRLLTHCVSAGLVDDTAAPLTAGFRFSYAGECQVVQQNPFTEGDRVGYYVQRFTRVGSDLYRLLVAPDAQPRADRQKRLVWDFLSDYLELGVDETAAAS